MLNISTALSGIIEGKEKISLGRVEVYDTTFTVPSSGFYVRYYSGVNPTITDSLKRTQFESIILKDWSNGLPVELSNYVGAQILSSGLILSEPFSVSYSGNFYADQAGLYKFATRSTGGTEIYINGIQVLSGFENITPTTTGYSSGMWPTKTLYWDGSSYLNQGWHTIKANFIWYSYSGINLSPNATRPFFTAFYTAPNDTEKLLSASVVNIYPQFIQPKYINNIMNITEDIDDNQAAQYSFEVSVPFSGEYSWIKQKEEFGHLKINRLCKIFIGYVTTNNYNSTSGYITNFSGSTDLIQKFEGLIDSVQFSQSANSITATVRCRDFFKKFINSINENYPNHSNYTPKVLSNLDKYGILNINQVMPNAYDNWTLFDTVETLALNAGIDPIKINKHKWDTQNYFRLESNLNWPYTNTYDINGVEDKNSDKFIFKFEYGENLNDEVKRVTDLVGYRCYFDEFGDLVLLDPRRTNRVEIYESGTYASKSIAYSGVWSQYLNVNASNRFYNAPILNGNFTTGVIRFAFSGVGLGIYQHNHTSGNYYTVEIYQNNPYARVFSGTYNNSGIVKYSVLNEITRNLTYDGYTTYIYPSGDVRFEGFEYYTQNIFKPVYTLKENRDIINLNVDLNDDIVRNEVIAVGQQISDKGYLYSKSIDLDSISNPDAFNYIGQKRTITLIEPTIQSQKRLDWLAQNILERFRRKQRNIQVTTQGLPHIQIGDPIGITSVRAGIYSDLVSGYDINNTEVFYVNKISSKIEDANYVTNFSLTSLKPIDAWRPPTPITTDMLQKIYDLNNSTIFSNFQQMTLNNPSGYGYDGFSEQAAFIKFDLLTDVDRLWVLISDQSNGGELFKYINTQSKDPIITYQTANNQDPNQPPQGAVWLHNGGGERWGSIVVPTAQNNFNGGQWAGQNSASNIRADGPYAIAIWAQFKTADNAMVFQGLWVPTSGTLDNRNRILGNTPTTTGNTYVQYTNTVNQQLLVSPAPNTVTTAYLPAFVINNSDFLLNAWVGPQASGYQIISNNNLTDLRSMFDYFGDRYSHELHTEIFGNVGGVPSPYNVYAGPFSIPYVSGNSNLNFQITKVGGIGPFNSGTKVVYSNSPDASMNLRFWDIATRQPFADRAQQNWLQAASWAHQGFNFITRPNYVKVVPQQTVTSPFSGIESIFHELNYLTLNANHEFYITIETSIFKPVFRWDSNCYGCLSNVTEHVFWRAVLDQPTKGPIAVYPTNRIKEMQTNDFSFNTYSLMGQLYRDKANYAKYKGNINVIFPGRLQNGEQGIGTDTNAGLDCWILTKYVFTESKSNRKFFFIIKWDKMAMNYPGYTQLFGAPYVGNGQTNYLRIL